MCRDIKYLTKVLAVYQSLENENIKFQVLTDCLPTSQLLLYFRKLKMYEFQ